MKKIHPYKDVGARLKLLRGDLTQKAFAKAVGLSERAYRRYERGERLPNLETLLKISAFCETEPDWIIRGKDKKPLSKQQLKDLGNILEKFKKGVAKEDGNLKSLIREFQNLRIKRQRFKFDLGVPPEKEECYRLDPVLAEAEDMLNFVFSYACEDVKEFVIEALDSASHLALLDLDMDGKPVQRGFTKTRKKKVRNDSQVKDL